MDYNTIFIEGIISGIIGVIISEPLLILKKWIIAKLKNWWINR